MIFLKKFYEFRFLSEHGYFNKKSEIYEDFTDTASKFLNCRVSEVIGIDCTSLGTNYVAYGLNLAPEDNIILNNFEFVSLYQPFYYQAERKGFKIKILELKNSDFSIWDYEKLIDERTKLIVFSLIEFSNGYRFDLEEVSRFREKHNITVFVDAIQAIGAFDVDVSKYNLDILSAGSSKWFSGFHGYGLFYIREELIDKIDMPFSYFPGILDQNQASIDYKTESLPGFYDINRNSMNKFILSTENLAGKICLTEMMKYFMNIGKKNIEERIIGLSKMLTDGLLKKGYKVNNPLNPENMSGIVSFVPSEDGNLFVKKMEANNIFLSYRYGGIRVSLHFFNTEDEIRRFLKYV